jgi:hypothetical protein
MSTDFACLVNETNIRQSIKRLFTNNAGEILGELLQNSQRAGAKNIAITTDADNNVVIIHDDGPGVDGIEGLHALLKMAESRYEESVMANQHPMGLGIHALLAHSAVRSVCFKTQDLELLVDTNRWWNDPEYYSTWFERVSRGHTPVEGLSVSAFVTTDLFNNLVGELPLTKPSVYTLSNNLNGTARRWPTLGFEDLLAITLDGKPVCTDVPDQVFNDKVVFRGTYQGSELVIMHGNSYGSHINWYGQMVPISLGYQVGGFSFYLKVRDGRPLNLKSPVRSGVITDDAYVAFLSTVAGHIVDSCKDSKAIAAGDITPHMLASALNKWPEEMKGCEYFVAKPLKEAEAYPTSHRYGGGYPTAHGERKALRYDDRSVTVVGDEGVIEYEDDGSTTSWDYGLPSFLRLVDFDVYQFDAGDRTRAQLTRLWWLPEGELDKETETFYPEGGVFGFLPQEVDGDDLPVDDDAVWKAVTQAVYVYDDANNYDVMDVTLRAFPGGSKLTFVDQFGKAFFDCSDATERDEESFDESLAAWRRKLIGNALPRTFGVHDLARLIGGKMPTSIEFVHEQGSFNPTHVLIKAVDTEPVKAVLVA